MRLDIRGRAGIAAGNAVGLDIALAATLAVIFFAVQSELPSSLAFPLVPALLLGRRRRRAEELLALRAGFFCRL
jgi:hypothetical protein